LEVGPVAFRFAAVAIALLFWLAALALLVGMPVAGILAGFSIAMIFNAVAPHLALTLAMRRYHPGTATAWLLVVPAAVTFIATTSGSGALTDRAFVVGAVAGLLGLAVCLPLLLTLGGVIERRLVG
jgi:hypothetical protein